MTLPNQDKIDSLKAEYGEINAYPVAGYEFICRCPTDAIYKKFRTQIMDENKRMNASEELVRACVVWPEREEFSSILKKRPGIVETLLGELTDWAGLVKSVEKKEL